MKKQVFILLSALLAIGQSAFAADFSVYTPGGQLLSYNIIGANTVEVTTSSSAAGSLIIPDSVTYNDVTYVVTRIGNAAFNNNSGLLSVVIPNSVTSIGDNAFYSSSNITSVTIGNSVTSIGGYAFYYCSRMASLTIGASIASIGQSAFQYCTSLTSVNYLGTLSQWCGIQFANNISNPTYYSHRLSINGTELTNLVIPSTVTSIGDYAFMGCNNLTSVTIGNSVTSIGSSAFNGCVNLPSVTIGNSVASIGNGAFYGCSNLTSVILMPETPPVLLGINCFASSGNWYMGNYYVPCGRVSSYQSVWGSNFTFQEQGIDMNVTLTSNNSLYGSADIVHNYFYSASCDSNTTIGAIANHGYHFDHWSDGNTQNPRTIHVVQDVALTAFFAPNQYTLTLQSANPSYGTVAGGGEFDYLDTVTITATATEHYHFTQWSDGSTDNPRQYVVMDNTTLTAYFSVDIHTVNVHPSDIARGSVTQSGSQFAYGTPCTVSATAYSGYTFIGWSDGMTSNPYTFAVLGDVELTALFIVEGEDVYTVTAVSANPQMGSVSGGGQAVSGSVVTLHATAYEGYRFVRWNDNNTDNPRTITVTSDMSFTAYFAAVQGIEDISGEKEEVRVYVADGRIHVTHDGQAVDGFHVYDMMGREMFRTGGITGETSALPAGVYLVKVGTLPARKVVVMR